MFAAHNIGYFFYNGGDSQDTAYKVSQLSTAGFPVTCIGKVKTVDNDLPSPTARLWFRSKYVAVATVKQGWTSRRWLRPPRVFILGDGAPCRMDRGCGGTGSSPGRSPHHRVPGQAFDEKAFLARLKRPLIRSATALSQYRKELTTGGRFLADTGTVDAFGLAVGRCRACPCGDD